LIRPFGETCCGNACRLIARDFFVGVALGVRVLGEAVGF
jgi:hypothetical protein